MIICFEGTDGSGKGTQSAKLRDYFLANNVDCELISFPVYDSPTGIEIKKYLNGEYGNLDDVDPFFAAKLYEDDRYAQQDRINGLLSQGKIVILDRYTLSNLAYQGAKRQGEEQEELINKILKLQNGLLPIDLGIFLDLPVGISAIRTVERGRAPDIHEVNTEYMEKVYDVYVRIAEEHNYMRIDCVENEGQRSIEDIFNEVLGIVKLKTDLIF